MRVKDYYKILELSPTSTLKDIKKSYRRLALQFHPDKNPGNPTAAFNFREIQEAYEVLSDPEKRGWYNYQLRQPLRGEPSIVLTFSPQDILAASLAIGKSVSLADKFRMNKESLNYEILQLLSRENLETLTHAGLGNLNRQVINNILYATGPLPYRYVGPILERLAILSGANEEILEKITKYQEQRKWTERWDKSYPWLVLILTFLLCWLIYSSAGR
jgi:molecular chaperone DnaJ